MSNEKLAEALRELFVKWLESRSSFRTTVEVEAAWEGWKANTAVAAMLAAEVTEPVAYGLFTESGLIRMWSKKWFGECDGKSCNPVPLYTHPQPSQDTKDAARYRFLADHQDADLYMENPGKELLDRAIDAAMAKEYGR